MTFNWEIIQNSLKERLSSRNYSTWIKPVYFDSYNESDEIVKLCIPDKFTYNWIIANYQDIILEEVINYLGKTVKVKFSISVAKEKDTISNDIKASAPKKIEEVNNFIFQVINSKYTFDEFVVGKCNEFARAAALKVSESPGNAFNPLFIYGGTGLGKTHLLCSIGLSILQKNPKAKLCYLNSEKFTNELINSIRHDKMDAFRRKFREDADVLLIDDIQFIAGKERTQEEFFFTFNELYQNKKQIVLTSDKNPKEIKNLEERLVTRFQWGLEADLQLPDIETRIAIIKNKVNLLKIELSDEIVNFLAKNHKANVRQIEGSLNRIYAYSSLSNLKITIPLLKRILPDICKSSNRLVSQDEIITNVCSYFDIKENDILSNSRKKAITLPRHIAMYLSRKLTSASFPQIGKNFGGRDHSTVMHAFEKIEKNINQNSEFERVVSHIENNLII